MKIGVAQWCLDVDGVASLDRAAEFGLSALHVSGGAVLFEDASLQAEYVGASRRTGVRMTMLSLNCVLRSGSLMEQETRRHVARTFEAAIRAAVNMGIGIVYLPSFVDLEIKTEQELQLTADILGEACRFAADKPVLVATENSLGVEELEQLFESVGEPNFRLFFDTQNPILWNHDPVKIIRRFSDRMCDQVHIKDGIDGQMGNAPLFEGQGRLTETIAVLNEVGFSGDLVLENYSQTDADINLPRDIAALRNILSKDLNR